MIGSLPVFNALFPYMHNVRDITTIAYKINVFDLQMKIKESIWGTFKRRK